MNFKGETSKVNPFKRAARFDRKQIYKFIHWPSYTTSGRKIFDFSPNRVSCFEVEILHCELNKIAILRNRNAMMSNTDCSIRPLSSQSTHPKIYKCGTGKGILVFFHCI